MKKKQVSIKKIAITGLCICIPIYIFFFIRNQHKIKTEIYGQKQTELYQTLKANQKKIPVDTVMVKKTDKQNEWVIYYPVNAKEEKITALNSALQNFQKEISKEIGNPEAPRKIIIEPNAKLIQKNLLRYSFTCASYTWQAKEEKWQYETLNAASQQLLNQKTNQLFTLKDLLTSESNVLALYHMMQQQILTKEKITSKNIRALLNLPLLEGTDTNFTYQEDKIVLHLKKNKLGITQWPISYNQLAGYLSEDFVAKKYILPLPQKKLDANKKYIALTFDDGPSKKTTEQVLKILQQKKVTATFFLLGKNVTENPAIVKKIHENGHEIGNHSYTHANFVTLKPQEVREEVTKTSAAIYRAAGILPNSLRPPYGAINEESAKQVALPLAMWSIDSEDWSLRNAKKILKQVKKEATNGGILLMHDIHQETLKSLPSVIDYLKEEGYEFLTYSELVCATQKPMISYYSAYDHRAVKK